MSILKMDAIDHKFRLWRALAVHTNVPYPSFKFSSIYRQRKEVLVQVAEAIGYQIPTNHTKAQIIEILENHTFT